MEPVPETREVIDRMAKEGDTEVAVVLLRMGRSAQEVVPECVGLSLGLVEEGLTFTLVASSKEAAALDAVQYLDGGPCVQASHQNETVAGELTDPLDESRWLMWARASAAAGVASSLSLPILRHGRLIGGVNLYASTPDAFDAHHAELAQALDASADGAITNADLSFSSRMEAAESPSRLADQHDVDLALGIIASSQDVDIPTARLRLVQAAARAGITEAQAARALSHMYHD